MPWTPPGFVPDAPDSAWRPPGFVPDTSADSAALAQGREMFSPKATTRRWLRIGPFVGGAAGGAVGGVPGATLGGMAGKLAEQGLGGTLPKSAKEAVDTIGGAGVEQGAYELISAIPGLAALVSGRIGDSIKRRAVASALEKVAAVAGAKNIEAPLAAEIAGSTAARRASADQASQILHVAAPGNDIPHAEIADRVIAAQEKAHGATYTPEARAAMLQRVRERVPEVVGEHTLDAIPASGDALSLEHANVAKQAFQQRSKPGYNAIEGGARPNPKLDMAIASAYKEAIEARAPAVGAANAATATEIREGQQLAKMKKSQPGARKGRVLSARDNAMARVQAVEAAGQSPLGLSLTHGVTINPSGVAGAMDAVKGVAGHPAAKATANTLAIIARLIAAGQRFNQPDSLATGGR